MCITGQVPSPLIGNDAFQECDTVGITRPCTKHNWLVRDVNDLAKVLHEAFYVASTGRPGPVVVDVPRMCSSRPAPITRRAIGRARVVRAARQGRRDADPQSGGDAGLRQTPGDLYRRRYHQFRSEASKVCCANWSRLTGFPITSTLMGLGAYPASGKNWLGMLGMHGTYEANMAMHDCDVMLCVGARFDDRITGAPTRFRRARRRSTSISIHPRSTRTSASMFPIIGDAANVLGDILQVFKAEAKKPDIRPWWQQIAKWRAQFAVLQEEQRCHPAAIRDPAAVRGHPRPRRLHHDRESASTRCGRRSSSASRSRTAG